MRILNVQEHFIIVDTNYSFLKRIIDTGMHNFCTTIIISIIYITAELKN